MARQRVVGCFQGRRSTLIPDHHEDPMSFMGNLFDVAMLIGVGFLIVALSGFGVKELLSEEVTIVKNPGEADMELIVKKGDTIERFKSTERRAGGQGQAIGTVYRLENGNVIWVPGSE